LAKASLKAPPLTDGERVCNWIEEWCVIPEGKFVGAHVKLRDWQRAEICKIYDNPAGTRRAIISFGRKNAKTTLAAFLLLVHLAGPQARPNSQLFSAAQSRDQAAILFALAAKIVRMGPLNAFVGIRDTAKQIYCGELGTLYRALSAEAKTAYGLSPVFIVHDELGQVRGPRSELYEALETATGAQESPLSVIISTQAPNEGDLLSILIDDAASDFDPRVVLSLHTAPENLDPFEDETIRLANPAFGDFLNPEEVRAMAADAKRMPSRMPEYRNLVLNQRVNMHSPLIGKDEWLKCRGSVRFTDGEPVYLALDLSSVDDLTALVMLSAEDGDRVLPFIWKPTEVLEPHGTRDTFDYRQRAKEGDLLTIAGRTIDPDVIAKKVAELHKRYRILGLAYDRWRIDEFLKSLDGLGIEAQKGEGPGLRLIDWGQGYASMAPAVDAFERSVLERRLVHPGNLVLTWNVANAVVSTDPAGNRKLDKAKARFRVDGAVALAMALGLKARDAKPEPPKKPQLAFF
jgi:phage terminase large subunit-like protein